MSEEDKLYRLTEIVLTRYFYIGVGFEVRICHWNRIQMSTVVMTHHITHRTIFRPWATSSGGRTSLFIRRVTHRRCSQIISQQARRSCSNQVSQLAPIPAVSQWFWNDQAISKCFTSTQCNRFEGIISQMLPIHPDKLNRWHALCRLDTARCTTNSWLTLLCR